MRMVGHILTGGISTFLFFDYANFFSNEEPKVLGIMIFMYFLAITIVDYMGLPTDIFHIWALIANPDPNKSIV